MEIILPGLNSSDILDIAKNEAQERIVESVPFDLEALLRSVMAMLAVKVIDNNKLSLRFDYPKAAPRFFVSDPTAIRQVVTNLVANAIKFTVAGEVSLLVSFHPVSGDTLAISEGDVNTVQTTKIVERFETVDKR